MSSPSVVVGDPEKPFIQLDSRQLHAGMTERTQNHRFIVDTTLEASDPYQITISAILHMVLNGNINSSSGP